MARHRSGVSPDATGSWPGMIGNVLVEDCIPIMGRIPDQSIDLGFADPPFNIDWEYDEYDDKLDAAEYLAWCGRWLREIRRVLKKDGSLWLAIGDKFVSQLDVLAQQLKFHKRSHVIWYYTFGVNCPKNFSKSKTHLLYYTRSRSNYTFNADACRVPSARQVEYNDKRASPEGRLPDDTWIIRPSQLGEAFEMDHDVWHASRICGTFKAKRKAANQMPEQILGRIIRTTSDPGDVVLDPFCGSGTTAAVARKLGRRFVTCDLSQAYAAQAILRIQSAKEGDALDGGGDAPKPERRRRNKAD